LLLTPSPPSTDTVLLVRSDGAFILRSLADGREHVLVEPGLYDISGDKALVLLGWPVRLSPDGEWLLIPTPDNGTWLVSLDGQTLRRVHDRRLLATWAPDSRRIAFTDSGGEPPRGEADRRIYVQDVVAGEPPRLLATLPQPARYPTWSPGCGGGPHAQDGDCGRHIAAFSCASGERYVCTIWLIEAAAGSVAALGEFSPVQVEWVPADFAWSPAGDSLVTMSASGPLAFPVDGSGPHPAPGVTACRRRCDTSPDGSLLARAESAAGEENRYRLVIARADSSASVTLEPAFEQVEAVRWTGDGRRVLLKSYADGAYHLWAMDPAGGEPQLMAGEAVFLGTLAELRRRSTEVSPPPAGPAVNDLSTVRAALAAHQPITDTRPTVAGLLDHIAPWLAAGGDLAELETALEQAATQNEAIGIKTGPVRVMAQDLTGDARDDVVVHVPVIGLPLLVFVDEKETFAGYALPPNYAETLIHSWPVDTALTLWGMPQPPLELVDLTGDGVAEILLTYLFPGGSAFHLQPIVFQWHAGDFRPVFAAHLVNWAGQAGLALETDPTGAGGRQIVLRYPYLYGDGFDHKMVNHPLGEEIWRWSESAGRFARAEARVDLERSDWGPDDPPTTGDQLRWFTNEGEHAFRHGDYDAALRWYNQALGLAAAEGWAPGDEDPDWLGYAAFRRAEALLLHGGQDPDVPAGYAPDGLTAMQAVAEAYQGDVLGELANAFLDGYAGGSDEDAGAGGVAAMQSVDLYTHFYYEGSNEPGALRFPMDAGGVLYPGAGLAAYLMAHPDLADDPEALSDGMIKAGFAAEEVEEAQGGQVQIGLRLPDAPNADGRLAFWTLAEGAAGWQVVRCDTHPYRDFDSLLLDRSAEWPVAGDFQISSTASPTSPAPPAATPVKEGPR
jgi:hypothetical protein